MKQLIQQFRKALFVSMLFMFTPMVYGSSLTVINKTHVDYKNIVIVITPVNFDASYGRFDTEEIKHGTTKQFEIPESSACIPLTAFSFSSSGLNLDVMVIIVPNEGKVHSYKVTKILQTPATIAIQADNGSNGMRKLLGLAPPNITIVILDDSGQEKVDIQSEELSLKPVE